MREIEPQIEVHNSSIGAAGKEDKVEDAELVYALDGPSEEQVEMKEEDKGILIFFKKGTKFCLKKI